MISWWRHQMKTFSALLVICAGNSPVPGEFHEQKPVTQSFDVFFDLHLNTWSNKQSWGWWFETLSHPLWRHCHVNRQNEYKLVDDIFYSFLMKIVVFWLQFHWNMFLRVQLKKQSSKPIGRLAIIWTNAGLVHRRIYATLTRPRLVHGKQLKT